MLDMSNKPKISVMQLTNRYGNIDILWANMKRQTIQDFEIVLVDGLWKEREDKVKRYINDPRLKYVRQSEKREGAYTNLAHADNEGFKNCDGELIVCLQDYQWIPPDGLEKYWFHYEKDPKALVTGIGHHYANPRPTNPNGLITVFDELYSLKPEGLSWEDPRVGGQSFRECDPVEWELSWASIPRSVIYDIGGMDEQFDFEGFAWDNTYIAYKARINGSKIYLDQTNEVMGFDHDIWWPNPLKVNRISPATYFHNKVQKMINKEIPLKDNFLE
jgi:hypothetical protein